MQVYVDFSYNIQAQDNNMQPCLFQSYWRQMSLWLVIQGSTRISLFTSIKPSLFAVAWSENSIYKLKH